MATHTGVNWNLPEKCENWTQVQVALLMDVRSELRKLNSKLDCSRVSRMLDTVERVDKRLAKKFGPLTNPRSK